MVDHVVEGESETAALPRVLLFSGHRIDSPGRRQKRFPADREEQAWGMILDAVVAEVETARAAHEELLGVAGGASGGDILFHEVCETLGVTTRMYLAVPKDRYLRASVLDAGPVWVARFQRLCDRLGPIEVGDWGDLPESMQTEGVDNDWQRSNLWMLYTGLAESGGNLTLIALWNGETGDGPGGTADMVVRASKQGARVVVLDAKKLAAGLRT